MGGDAKGYAALAATVAVWGTAYPVTAVAERFYSPVLIAAVRALVGGAFLAALVRGRLRPSLKGFVGGAINIAGMVTLLNLSIYLVPNPSTAAVLIYTQPVFVALIYVLALRRPMSALQAAGVAMGMAGVATLSLAAGPDLPGVLLGLAGGLVWAVGTVYYELNLASEDPVSATAFMSLSASPLIMAFAPLGLWARVTPASLLLLLYIAVVVHGAAWALWFYGVRRLGGVSASTTAMLTPVVAIVSTELMLREVMGPLELAAAALVVAGSLVSQLAGRRSGRGPHRELGAGTD